MAYLKVPEINPIRIYATDSIDYNTVWPTIDKIRPRKNYRKGIYANENIYQDWVNGNTLSLQVELRGGILNTLTAYLVNMTTGAKTFCSVGKKTVSTGIICTILTSPPTGYYRIMLTTEASTESTAVINYYSDVFYVHSTTQTNENKELVKFQFRDSKNAHNGYFYSNSTTNVWFPIAFYTGIWTTGNPEVDETVVIDENLNEYTTRAEYQRTIDLTLTEIHEGLINVIRAQTLCNEFYFNDERYKVKSFEPRKNDEKQDLFDIEMKLVLISDDKYLNI